MHFADCYCRPSGVYMAFEICNVMLETPGIYGVKLVVHQCAQIEIPNNKVTEEFMQASFPIGLLMM